MFAILAGSVLDAGVLCQGTLFIRLKGVTSCFSSLAFWHWVRTSSASRISCKHNTWINPRKTSVKKTKNYCCHQNMWTPSAWMWKMKDWICTLFEKFTFIVLPTTQTHACTHNAFSSSIQIIFSIKHHSYTTALQCLAQRNFSTQTGGSADQTNEFLVSGWPALFHESQPPIMEINCI